ncbi:MAG TPA: CBS domain-containing protein [Massilibacterium sp.]|nr:CBS domain-containing protein [Massilibacterium sp.]
MKMVKDVMTHEIECCYPQDNVFEAAQKMKQLNVGSIPICDEQKQLIGMVTDRDIVVRSVADKLPNATQVTDVMTSNPISVTPDTHVQEATNIMAENQIRRLPVVENNQLIGIVSLGDFAVRNETDQSAGNALSSISETH